MNLLTRYIIIGVVISTLIFIIWFFSNIIAYILISYVLSLIGHPIVTVLGRVKYKKFQISLFFRAIITISFLYTLFYFFLRFFIPLVAEQMNLFSQIDVQQLLQNLQIPIKKLDDYLTNLGLIKDDSSSLQYYIAHQFNNFIDANMMKDFFGSIVSIIGNIFIGILSVTFITFFFLKDDELFAQTLLLFIPDQYEEAVIKVLSSAKNLLSRYFIGICFQILGIIILTTSGLMLIGIKFNTAIVCGLFAGVVNVVPYVGPLIGSIFGVVITIITNIHLDFSTELTPLIYYSIAVYIVIHIIDNIIFQPFIYSNSVMAHPLEIFIVILIAGSVGGMIGMLLAIPIYTIFRVIAKEFLNKFKIVRKITENIKSDE